MSDTNLATIWNDFLDLRRCARRVFGYTVSLQDSIHREIIGAIPLNPKSWKALVQAVQPEIERDAGRVTELRGKFIPELALTIAQVIDLHLQSVDEIDQCRHRVLAGLAILISRANGSVKQSQWNELYDRLDLPGAEAICRIERQLQEEFARLEQGLPNLLKAKEEPPTIEEWSQPKTITEWAREFGYHRNQMSVLLKDGTIKAKKFRGRWCIHRSGLLFKTPKK